MTGSMFGNNAYLPDRSTKGGDSLDDLIKNLAWSVVRNLDQLQADTNSGMLLQTNEEELREEAQILFKQIDALKQKLLKLTEQEM